MDRALQYISGGVASTALIAGAIAAFISITALVGDTNFPNGSLVQPPGGPHSVRIAEPSQPPARAHRSRGAADADGVLGWGSPPARVGRPRAQRGHDTERLRHRRPPRGRAPPSAGSGRGGTQPGSPGGGGGTHLSPVGGNGSPPSGGTGPSAPPSAAPPPGGTPPPTSGGGTPASTPPSGGTGPPSTPPGLATKPGGLPPGLAKKPGGTPPGLASKPGGLPPGLAKKPGGLPPGQAKKG